MKMLKQSFLAAVMLALAFLAWLFQAILLRRFIRPVNKSLRRHAYLLGLRLRRPVPILRSPLAAQFCNIGEGTHEHGRMTYIPDAATTSRYLLYKIGTGVNGPAAMSCTLTTAATDYPLGSSDDQADANFLTQGITINLFGACPGTKRVISDGTIVNGSWVGPSGATAGYATVATTGNCTIGKAIVPPDTIIAAGQPVEIIPCLPSKLSF